MSEFEKLTDDELKALFQVDPSAAPINPWHPRFDNTPKGKEIRIRYEAEHPTLAAGLKQKAPGFNLSARAEMYNRGLIQLDQQIHDELMASDPTYRIQRESNQQAWEQKMINEMEAEASKAAAARGVDLDSKLHAGNFNPKFAKYWRDQQQQQLLEEQMRRESK